MNRSPGQPDVIRYNALIVSRPCSVVSSQQFVSAIDSVPNRFTKTSYKRYDQRQAWVAHLLRGDLYQLAGISGANKEGEAN